MGRTSSGLQRPRASAEPLRQTTSPEAVAGTRTEKVQARLEEDEDEDEESILLFSAGGSIGSDDFCSFDPSLAMPT